VKITDITRQTKRQGRCNIFVDGEFALGLSDEDLMTHRLSIGMEISQEELANLQNAIEYTRARDMAVVYLSHSPRSAKEVAKKLAEKEFSPASIERVIDLLIKNGYINDIDFASALIKRRLGESLHGKKRIVGELYQRGVAKSDILAAFAQIDEEGNDPRNSEETAARAALAKKLRNKDHATIASNPKEIAKLTAFLARRGFDYNTIKHAMTMLESRE